jgi:predicted MPP superfamily phosphohydrolase
MAYPKQPKSEKDFDFKFDRQPMVDWFSPSQLFDTGIKTLLSQVFGAYADKREMQAALQHKNEKLYFDYSENKEGFWFDYIADLGDGWNSTYAMAKWLAKEQLSFEDGKFKTERGKILIMGGDEVYPTATREAYNNRLDGAYRAALPYVTDEEKRPHLFAIPGNHDWYDGLTSFIRFFCQGDNIGGWKTQQTRSYFAIKLPHNWWLWGIDIQLDADIDKPQQDFFTNITKKMEKDDKVILCTAEPEWVHAEIKDSKCYENLVWFEKEIIRPKGVLAITLTGDLHHYCRYEDSNGTRQKIIAGGGGAYLYPTHTMPEELKVSAAEENAPQEKVTYSRAKAVFPDVGTSRLLAFRALLLPFQNWKFASFIGMIYLLYAWILQSSYIEVEGDFFGTTTKINTLMDYIAKLQLSDIFFVFENVGYALLYSPEGFVLTLMAVFGLRVFCDKKKWKWVGSLHGIAHLVLIVLLFWFFSYLNIQVWDFQTGSLSHVLLFSAEMIVVGGLLGSSLVGLYLVIGSSLLGINVNEVFACQSIPDYKNFLRLHINDAGQLTVYPIGVKKVSRKWKWNPEAKEGESWFKPNDSRGVNPHLIEDPLKIKLPKD